MSVRALVSVSAPDNDFFRDDYSSSLFHVVFSTKGRRKHLDPSLRKRLCPYLGGIARRNEMQLLAVGGVEDHVHLLLCIPANLALSKAMDTFDPARTYGSDSAAWRRIRAALLVVGISSDWLFPASDVRALAEHARALGVNATYAELESSHGHDGFLADAEALARIIELHLEEEAFSDQVLAGRR